jgi:hypothetical protein
MPPVRAVADFLNPAAAFCCGLLRESAPKADVGPMARLLFRLKIKEVKPG